MSDTSGRSGRLSITVGSPGRLVEVRHRIVAPPALDGPLTIAVLSDLHVNEPWSSPDALERHVMQVNEGRPDLVLLPGDFLADGNMVGRATPIEQTAAILSGLDAPLGVFASLGNHDWKDCDRAKGNGYRESSVPPALAAHGIRVLINDAVALDGSGLWIAGFDSQVGHGSTRRPVPRHDPDATYAQVPDGAPVILLAHEPDWFAARDQRAFLQVSGHTHGGQLDLFGWRPLAPTRLASGLARGHITTEGRHMVVSTGVGYSGLPMRIGAPPELTIIELVETG